MSFGVSVGDFVTLGKLVAEVASSLKNASGAKSEYQETFRALCDLDAALVRLDKLHSNKSTDPSLESLKYAALSCRRPLEDFQASIKKYDKSLGLGSSGRCIRSTPSKLSWTFQQKKALSQLQKYLDIHVAGINIKLNGYGLEKLDCISKEIGTCQLQNQEELEKISDTLEGVRNYIEEQPTELHPQNSTVNRLYQIACEDFPASWNFLVEKIRHIWYVGLKLLRNFSHQLLVFQ